MSRTCICTCIQAYIQAYISTDFLQCRQWCFGLTDDAYATLEKLDGSSHESLTQ